MREFIRGIILVTACFLIFQNGAPAGASDLKDPGVKRDDLPRAFLSKIEGSVIFRTKGESMALSTSGATMEEILEKIAEEKKVILKFYCSDPALKHERGASLRISDNSILKVLQRLLSDDHRFILLNREDKSTEDEKEVATVNIYSKECIGTDHPVRVFIGQRRHPLLNKPSEEISVEDLRDVLKREGPASRRRAADVLRLKADEKGIPYAKEALKDENIRVMFAAANALKSLGQQYGTEKVVDAVYERFRERPYEDLLLVMAQLKTEKLWPFIDGLMDQAGERERRIIVKTLFLTNDRRAVKYLSKIATTGSMENSRLAIHNIGKLGGPEAATILMRLLREGDPQRQARAAQAVHFLPGDEGFDLRAEVEKIVRQETVPDALLHALLEASYLEPLQKLMTDPASKPELKIRALRMMVDMGAERATGVMSIGLNDKAPQVRLASVEALGAIEAEAAIPYLIKATEHEDAKVRMGAVKGLSGFPRNDRIAETLGRAIDDTDQDVRRQAVDVLDVLGKPTDTVVAILRRCENHKDPYVKNKADSILRYRHLK